MEDKKKTPVHDFLTNIASLFGLLFVFALILLPFASVGFIADGYPTVGRVLLGIFAVQLLITVFYFKHLKKKRAARETEYRKQNIIEYESDGGRLGMLLLEYDKCKDCTRLKNGFPAIFTEDETPSLAAYGERTDGRKIESIADRLLADRGLIFQGLLEKYNKDVQLRSAADPEPSGIKLEEINIEDAGTTVICYFSFEGIPNTDIYIEVSYTVSKEGYRFELEYD